MTDSQYDVLIKETNTRTKLVFADDPTRNVGQEVTESADGGGGGATFTQQDGAPTTLVNGAEVVITHPAIVTDMILVGVVKLVPAGYDIQTPTNANANTASMLRINDDNAPDYAAWHVFSGGTIDAQTYYSGVSQCWLGYDFGLGVTKEITQWALKGHVSYITHSVWALEYSDDNVTWTEADRFGATEIAAPDVLYTRNGYANPGAHRYWRAYCISSGSIPNVQVSDLRFYTTGSVTKEGASVGGYSSSGVEFGYQRRSDTTTAVKNMSGHDYDVTVNIVTP